MATSTSVYGQSLALLTDLYQLTMAYGYWKLGRSEEYAAFNLFFRQNPFGGGYTVAGGLAYVLDYVKRLEFSDCDLQYLQGLTGNDDQPLFESEFLDYLGNLKFTGDIYGVPEGTVVFPHQPLVRVEGPILQCQILETPLLNMVNYQTLIATKASRICTAANGEEVLEFGLRRAQGIDGALAASRAAYIGGCAATSNVLAGKLFGIPVRGTHAHSWVMSFDDELEAFDKYANVMPNNCVFLVDTYDTLDGVQRAIKVGQRLRRVGHRMAGIRLDSGDLAYLSRRARAMLDDAGFEDAIIVASNDLDEHIIKSLQEQGSIINVWGVGTRLATAFDQPALGGVYKLAAIRSRDGTWRHKVKLSEQAIKVSTPGLLQIRRFSDDVGFVADMTFDELTAKNTDPVPSPTIVHPLDHTRRKTIDPSCTATDLLERVFQDGRPVYTCPSLHQVRERTLHQLSCLHAGVRRFVNPHQYPAGIEKSLHELKTRLVLQARET
ncbi:MAG: nicotinate phosphoribosyltransferase [Planctomycetota bacterium]